MAKVDVTEVNSMTTVSKVVIFSKTYCRISRITKDIFAKLNQDTKIYELDEIENGSEIQNTLNAMTGAKSVPVVFINGKFIGAGKNVEKMEKDGSLQDLLI